jgi:hypothetical protein
MSVLGGNQQRDSADEQPPVVYELPDPELRAYDHGMGTLRVDGELKGYLASIVGRMRFPRDEPWPWFVVVWADGQKENPFEDYGPSWWTVRELDAGYFDHHERSVPGEMRFLWWRIKSSRPGPECTFEFEWLPRDEAAAKWQELGLVDRDF